MAEALDRAVKGIRSAGALGPVPASAKAGPYAPDPDEVDEVLNSSS